MKHLHPRRDAAESGGNSAPVGDEHEPLDVRYRRIGGTLVRRFNALIRMGRAYSVDNKVFQAQLDLVFLLIQPILDEIGEVVFVSLESDLYLNGVRIPVKANTLKYHDSLLDELHKRGIAGFKIEKDAKPREHDTFFELFFQPDVYYGTAFLEGCIANGCDRVLPVINASADLDDLYDSGGTLWPSGDANEGAFGGAVGPATEVGRGDGVANGLAGVGPAAPRGAATKSYAMAIVGVRSLLTATSVQNGLEMRHAKRVIQPIVDGANSDEPLVVGLTTLGHRDDFTYAHAVNVSIVATSIGKFLGLDRRALADLAVAALLHDVGKSAVADKITNPIGSFTDEEREMCEQHPLEGAKLLARSTTLNATTLRCLRVTLEHHAHADGTGYPRLPKLHKVSLLARLVAIADCFVSLQTHRSEAGLGVTPYEALGMILGPLAERFDKALLWALVQTVGFYPAGQLVELDDCSVAFVLHPNPNDLARPHVRVVREPNGEVVTHGKPREFRPIPNDTQIKRAIPGDEYPAILDPEAA
jgi:HD-GYP domain-containing protein (c-di-GMP phosphodiesterase class II)